MTNPIKTLGLTGGYNVIPRYAVQMMKTTKLLYNKDGGRQLIHVIVSPSKAENISAKAMYEISSYIASNFNDFQVLFSVHSDTENIHTHFMINTVSFRNGSRINDNNLKYSLEKICSEIFPVQN